MGREASTSYERVCNAIDELLTQGIKPSVRAVRTLVGGGSMSTINKHLQQWRETHAHESDISPRLLPPKLQRAVFEFIDQEVTRVHVDLEEALSETKRDMRALADENERLYGEVASLNADIGALTDGKAALEGRISQLLADLASARQEAAAERQNAEFERIELAKTKQRLETLALMEREAERARRDFEVQRDARVQAEQEVAVLKAQKANLQERLTELKAERGHPVIPDGGEAAATNGQVRRKRRAHPASSMAASAPATEHDSTPRGDPDPAETISEDAKDTSQMPLC